MSRHYLLFSAITCGTAMCSWAVADLIQGWDLLASVNDWDPYNSVDDSDADGSTVVQIPYHATLEAALGPNLTARTTLDFVWSEDGHGLFAADTAQRARGAYSCFASSSMRLFLDPPVDLRLHFQGTYTYALPPGDRAARIGFGIALLPDEESYFGRSLRALPIIGDPTSGVLTIDEVVYLPVRPEGSTYSFLALTELDSYGGNPLQVATGAGRVELSVEPAVHFDRGDLNCDGSIDGADAQLLVTAVLFPSLYHREHAYCDPRTPDVNDDGVVDGKDVQAFVNVLLSP